MTSSTYYLFTILPSFLTAKIQDSHSTQLNYHLISAVSSTDNRYIQTSRELRPTFFYVKIFLTLGTYLHFVDKAEYVKGSQKSAAAFLHNWLLILLLFYLISKIQDSSSTQLDYHFISPWCLLPTTRTYRPTVES